MTIVKKEEKKDSILLIAVLLISIVLEVILSNASFLSMKLGGYQEKTLDINSAKVSGDAKIIDGCLVAQNGSALFEDVDTEMKNVYIAVAGTESRYTRLDVTFTDDNYAYVDAAQSNYDVFKIFVTTEYDNTINKSSYGNVREFALFFPEETDESPYVITSLTLNKMPEPGFNLMRFLVFVLTGFFIYKKVWYGKAEKLETKIIAGLGAFMALLVILVSLMIPSGSNGTMFDNYPLDDPNTNDQYELLFDAFHNGRTTVNVGVDESVWNSLDDPYDHSERAKKGVDEDAWDRAYYEGKFYSYFGVAPVFVIYYPIYLLTGSLPCSILASAITACLSILFISVLYLELNKRFFDGIPTFFVVLGYLALLFGSLIFALWTDRFFYFLAADFGIGSLAAFFAFLLKAYYSDKFNKRMIFLILTSISIVMIAASRPSLLIYCAAAIVPLVYVMGDKKETVKNKIFYLIAAAVPAMIGACGIMAYNYVRFGSPVEFGFNYQVTVSDPRANSIMLSFIPYAIYHYYLQAPKLSTVFPYINAELKALWQYPRYTYLANNIGAFFFPLSLGILGTPVLFTRKKNGFREYFFGTILLCALVLSFIDMCKAGVHYRYVADILFALLVVSLVVVFDIMKKIKETDNKKLLSLWNGMVTLLMILTVAMGFLLIFANENKFLVIAPS